MSASIENLNRCSVELLQEGENGRRNDVALLTKYDEEGGVARRFLVVTTHEEAEVVLLSAPLSARDFLRIAATGEFPRTRDELHAWTWLEDPAAARDAGHDRHLEEPSEAHASTVGR